MKTLINNYTRLKIQGIMSIVFLCFVIPFLYTNYTFDAVLHPRFLSWSIFLFVSMLLFLISNDSFSMNDEIVIQKSHILLAAFVIFSLISVLKAVNISEGMFDFLKNFCFFLSFLVFFNLFRNNKRFINNVSLGMTVSGFVTGGILLVMFMKDANSASSLQKTFQIFQNIFEKHGFMVSKNQLSQSLFLFSPFSIRLVFTKSIMSKVFGLATTAILFVSIIIIQTRSVVMALMVAILIIFIISMVHLIKEKKYTFLSSLPLLIVLIVGLLLVIEWIAPYNFISNFINRFFTTSFDLSHPTADARIKLWKESLKLFSDNMLFGAGGGNWKLMLPSVGISSLPFDAFNLKFYQRPHNDPLWMMCEYGIIGFSVFYIFIGYIYYNLVKKCFQKNNTNFRFDIIIMLFVLTGYLVISLFSFPRERILHQVLLSLFLAYSSYLIVDTGKLGGTYKITGKPIITLFIVSILLLSIVYSGYRIKGEYYTKRSLYFRANKQWEQVIMEINKGYSPFYTIDQTSIPLKYYNGVARYSLAQYTTAIEDFKQAKTQSPYNMHVLNNLGSAYFNIGSYNESIQAYQEVLKYYPWFSEAVANLAVAYIENGDIDEAIKLLQHDNIEEGRRSEIINYLKSIGVTI